MTPAEIASLLLKQYRQPDFSLTIKQLEPELTLAVLDELIRRIADERLRNARRALQFAEPHEKHFKLPADRQSLSI